MRHATQAVIGADRAIVRCTCGWTSKPVPRADVWKARQDGADHIIAETQIDLPIGKQTAKA